MSPMSDLSPPTTARSLYAVPGANRRTRSRLETLPRALLAHIAYLVVVDNQGVGRHPSQLIPLQLTCRTIYNCISFDNNAQLYNNLFRATFDSSALDRRYEWMTKHVADMAGRGRKIFDLFADPRSWAIDYKTRWEQSWRMREVAKQQRLEIPGVSSRDQLVADLWNVWFLLTENGEFFGAWMVSDCTIVGPANVRRAEYPLFGARVQLSRMDHRLLQRRHAEGIARPGLPQGNGRKVARDLVCSALWRRLDPRANADGRG